MKKKVIIIGLISLVAIIISIVTVDKIIKDKNYENQCNEAFNDLFVTERNQVFTLYQAVGEAIESKTLDNDRYRELLEIAVKTETVCCDTFGKLSDLVETYGAGLVYYATFYRDVKSYLTRQCGVDELQDIYTLLDEIILLYDDHPITATYNEKLKAVSEFYYSLSLRNEDLAELCK